VETYLGAEGSRKAFYYVSPWRKFHSSIGGRPKKSQGQAAVRYINLMLALRDALDSGLTPSPAAGRRSHSPKAQAKICSWSRRSSDTNSERHQSCPASRAIQSCGSRPLGSMSSRDFIAGIAHADEAFFIGTAPKYANQEVADEDRRRRRFGL